MIGARQRDGIEDQGTAELWRVGTEGGSPGTARGGSPGAGGEVPTGTEPPKPPTETEPPKPPTVGTPRLYVRVGSVTVKTRTTEGDALLGIIPIERFGQDQVAVLAISDPGSTTVLTSSAKWQYPREGTTAPTVAENEPHAIWQTAVAVKPYAESGKPMVNLHSWVQFWEYDIGSLDRAYRDTLKNGSLAAVTLAHGAAPGTLGAVIGQAGDFVTGLAERVIGFFTGIGNEFMGEIEFRLEEQDISPTTAVIDFNWINPPKSELTAVSNDAVRITRTFKQFGGEWEVVVEVMRVPG